MNNQRLSDLAKASAPRSTQGQAAPAPKINTEIDAKLNEFISANKETYDYYASLPKERLVRSLMLNKMKEASFRELRQQKEVESLKAFVKSHPEIDNRITTKLQNVPEDKKIGAFVVMARREAQTFAMSSGQKP
jgi:hypothetical protein